MFLDPVTNIVASAHHIYIINLIRSDPKAVNHATIDVHRGSEKGFMLKSAGHCGV